MCHITLSLLFPVGVCNNQEFHKPLRNLYIFYIDIRFIIVHNMANQYPKNSKIILYIYSVDRELLSRNQVIESEIREAERFHNLLIYRTYPLNC